VIAMRRNAEGLLEGPAEMIGAQAGKLGELGWGTGSARCSSIYDRSLVEGARADLARHLDERQQGERPNQNGVPLGFLLTA